METTTQYIPTITTKTRFEAMGKGQLRIYSAYKDGQLIGEAFTLESLAHVLDMPMSTMDGRYARGKLAKWNVPIINGYGRPARGFPLQLLQQVIDIINTRGACVGHDVNGSGPSRLKPVRQAHDLVPEYFEGSQHFTIPALSVAFGYSETTMRKKLERAGLMRKFVDLAANRYGGRPKRGIAAKYLPDVKLAIEEGIPFLTGMERVLNREGLDQAKVDMQASIVPHEPPVPNSLRAWDRDTLAPARVNAVKSDGYDSAKVAAELALELEGIMAGAKAQPLPPVTAQDHTTTPPPQNDAPEPTDPEIAKQAWAWHLNNLTAQEDEPTAEDYSDTVDMMSLSKADADRFVAEVKAARGVA